MPLASYFPMIFTEVMPIATLLHQTRFMTLAPGHRNLDNAISMCQRVTRGEFVEPISPT